ncbi:MAG: terpene cyclase/mutase family protein [Verrucomicrobiae bacterium]|nr:terpene cyclase/mutase family protein [Verrucomicrobiae bacterium]
MKPSLAAGFLAALLCLAPPAVPAQQLFTEDNAANPVVIDRMYLQGLRFLAQTQMKDGKWAENYGSQPGVVGLSVVAFLAHGDDPNFGPFSASIRSGLDFILNNQNKETGYIGTSMYNHGFATLALAEAYGAVDEPRLGPALDKAVQLILISQKQNPKGGWRYSPESKEADTTVSGAQMVALLAARNAGLAVEESAIQRGLQFFQSCKTTEGGYGYTGPAGPNSARTAIGVLVLALAKQKSTPEYKSAFDYLEKAPLENHYYQYYLYYAAQAYFHSSPAAWRKWNAANIASLSATQNKNGSWDGPFGTTFATSASLLSLALNYRFLPIYER